MSASEYQQAAEQTMDAETVEQLVQQATAADRMRKRECCERLEADIAALKEQYQDAVAAIEGELRPLERQMEHRSARTVTGQRLREEISELKEQLRTEQRQFRREYRTLREALQEAQHELAVVDEEQDTLRELVGEVLE